MRCAPRPIFYGGVLTLSGYRPRDEVRSEALKSSLTKVSERDAAPPAQVFPCRSLSASSDVQGPSSPEWKA